jgi:hypothetical protein
MNNLNGRDVRRWQYHVRPRAPEPEPEACARCPRRKRPDCRLARERPVRYEEPEAVEREEARPMFRRRTKEEERPPRPVDRSSAVTVSFNPGTNEYHGRKCLFHGESAVAVCPNCGTLFCMECVGHFDACPRCNLLINFVDQSKVPLAVDDRDLIETEAQRKAIQQRWAMKRLAEAEMGSQAKKREIRRSPGREEDGGEADADTHRSYGAPLVQDAPKQAYGPRCRGRRRSSSRRPCGRDQRAAAGRS